MAPQSTRCSSIIEESRDGDKSDFSFQVLSSVVQFHDFNIGDMSSVKKLAVKALAFLYPRLVDNYLHPKLAAKTPELPQDILLLQQTPCLLYTSESAGAMAMGLYSLAEKKAYTLTLPDPPICSRHIIGSSYGWIITADERSELHLLNPITGEQIDLPSVTTIEQVKPIFDDAGAICSYEYSWYSGDHVESDTPSIFVVSELRDLLFHKAFLSSDPSMGDYFVVVIHNPHAQLSFGEIHEFDLGAPAATQKITFGKVKNCNFETIYMVQASCGELLQIWRDENLAEGDEDDESDSDPDHRTRVYITSFKVHKVEPTSKTLVEMSSLGENVLFLGKNRSLCLSAAEYPQLKANHIYFSDDNELITGFKYTRRDIGVFDMENNSTEEIVSPQLWSNWPAPVWLVPNPRRRSSLCC
ncbi:hypothetical protein ACP70R_008311 [Stipagrostis hirtigluma subsp. patula]